MAHPESLLCERDGERTLLTCAQCSEPICPRCLVRTPVGMKCHGCSGQQARAGGRRAWLVPVTVAALTLVALVVPRLASSPSPESTFDDPGASPSGTIVSQPVPVRIGQPTRDADLLIIVSSFECGAKSVEPGTAQGRFCFLSVGLRNVGQAPVTLVASAQLLADPLARRFGPDPSATAAHPSNTGRDLAALVINPGNQIEAVLVYDVPPDVMPVAAQLRASPASAGAIVALNVTR